MARGGCARCRGLGLGLDGVAPPLLPHEASGLLHARLLAHSVGLVLGIQVPCPDLVRVRLRVGVGIRVGVGVWVKGWG